MGAPMMPEPDEPDPLAPCGRSLLDGGVGDLERAVDDLEPLRHLLLGDAAAAGSSSASTNGSSCTGRCRAGTG